MLCSFPATFTFVLRAFSTLEGIGKSLNPQFKFVEVATPYAQELLTVRPAQCCLQSRRDVFVIVFTATPELALKRHT